MKFILTWVLTALAVSVALYVVPGISFVGTQWVAVFATALVLSLVNASVKPVLQLLSLPITSASRSASSPWSSTPPCSGSPPGSASTSSERAS